MRRRSQAERDAMTVEIGFAVLTGALLAAGAFVAVSVPCVFLAPRSGLRPVLGAIAAAVAVLVFLGRVIDVLWRFGRRDTAAEVGARGPASPGQPSQPGRTSPDS
ncbi:DUF6332 family protein [Streptomyces sp. RKAG290]|uniref:DUF6332 family protein n=1 Tax=Streptomyces sp. RKAG290 TaxID=2888348 RepID=UPI00203438ED|nr:DUF6332 family protein [Streptomyces sp. RKAG290]MCM2415709.1 DUF6332 family protein [Streptomyces sp. RKAG290]